MFGLLLAGQTSTYLVHTASINMTSLHAPPPLQAPLKPYEGPSVFQRAVAARQLAWLARSLRHPYLGALMPALLPAILTALDDPSPAVAVHGVWALHHLATEGLAAGEEADGGGS